MKFPEFFEKLENSIKKINIAKFSKKLKKFSGSLKLNSQFHPAWQKHEYVIENISNDKILYVKNLRNCLLIIRNCDINQIQFINCEIVILTLQNCKISKITLNEYTGKIEISKCSLGFVNISNNAFHMHYFSQCWINKLINDSEQCLVFNECIINNLIIKKEIRLNNSICKMLTTNHYNSGYIGHIHNSFIKTNLIINWFHLIQMHFSFDNSNEKLMQQCMAVDAQHHPNPDLFDKWAKGGDCPYKNGKIRRMIFFYEKRDCWNPELKTLHVNIPNLYKELLKTTNSIVTV